jgi:uncharacterized protein YgiM (DUF1202 family)
MLKQLITASLLTLAIALPAYAAPEGTGTTPAYGSLAAIQSGNMVATVKPLEGSYINLRISPTSKAFARLQRGSKVTLLNRTKHPTNGSIWYQVRVNGTGQTGWAIGTGLNF